MIRVRGQTPGAEIAVVKRVFREVSDNRRYLG